MKTGAYYTMVFMSLICLALTVTLVVMNYVNQGQQVKLQTQQQLLSQGVLGPQAQQISGAILQSLADASEKDSDIRRVLEKHGYRVTPSEGGAVEEKSPDSPAQPEKPVVDKPAVDEEVKP